jgi:hypothetical protein
MKRFAGRRPNLDWYVVVTAIAVGVAVLYGVLDRTWYSGQAHKRTTLRIQAVDAWHGLFVAEAEAQRRAHAHASAQQDSIALTRDAILTAHVVLQDAARRSGVHIVSMTPSDPRTVGGLVRTPLSTVVEGSYPNIVRFLARAEAAPLLLDVSGATISTGDTPGARITGSIAFVIHTLPQGGSPQG